MVRKGNINMEQIKKANKDHLCDFCERPIAKGEVYTFTTARVGRFDDNDKQIGVEFIRMKQHIHEKGDVPCWAPEDCRKGDHPDYQFESGYNGDQLSGLKEGYYCVQCGHYLTIEQFKKDQQ